MGKFKTDIKWGLIFVVAALLWMVFEKVMGWHGPKIEQHAAMTNIFAVIAIAVYVFALRDKKHNDLGGQMSWTQGFLSGMIITAIVVVFSPLSQWIVHTLISPEYFPNIIKYSVEEGMWPDRASAEAYFSLGNYMVISAVSALILGILTSAIVAFFVRTRPSTGSEAAAG